MENVQLGEHDFRRFRDLVYAKSGIRVPDNKVSLLSNRVRRRLKARGLCDFGQYYRYLTGPSGDLEISHFLDAVTTNETFFFRTDSHFEWLTNEFVPQVVARKREGSRPASLKIWSAGCATGAEPYTLAICLLENRYRLRDWSVEILATDISEETLREAREGIFGRRAVEDVSQKRLRRWFNPVDGEERWQVRPALVESVRFEHHNLMDPMREGPFDCVFIRNVLIYFDRESKQQVVSNLVEALAPGGYLVVGPSEGIYDMLQPLERCKTLIYRKPVEDPS